MTSTKHNIAPTACLDMKQFDIYLVVPALHPCRSKRVTNTISFGWLGLQLQASGPLTVKSPTRWGFLGTRVMLRC